MYCKINDIRAPVVSLVCMKNLTLVLFNLGIYGIMVMGIGIIISGIFILKKNPNARAVAAWIAFTALAYAIGTIYYLLFKLIVDNISRF